MIDTSTYNDYIRGYKLTDRQSEDMLMIEIDKALSLPIDFYDTIKKFIRED